MFIIWGFGHKTTKSFGMMTSNTCHRCNNHVQRAMVKVTTWFTIFFIPIIPYRKQYLMVCPICNDVIESSKEEFESMIEGTYSDSQPASPIMGRPMEQPDKYKGKTEIQIAYLKQMEEIKKEQEAKAE